MAFSKSLIAKGLGSAGALLGAGGLVWFREDIFGANVDLSSLNHKQLIEKVGLDCQLNNDDIGDETKECSVKTEVGKINVKRGQVEEGVTYSGSSSKLKVSRSEVGGYTKNLKFVVDSGDISLSKTEGNSTIEKLEQFETYEITAERGGKFYLTRKTEAKEEKKNILGLSKCTLPESGHSDCSLTVEEAKKIKFDGHTGDVTVSGNDPVALKISKMEDTTNFGEDDYRFTFTFPGDSDVSIGSNSFKTNTPYDFKIKKTPSSNTLALEKAWTSESLGTKAGLSCQTSSDSCTITSGKLNVMVGNQRVENKNATATNGGKIKVEKDQAGYNEGFKFTIDTSSFTLTDGGEISKLEEFETYEIKEEGGKYYLTRKTGREGIIRSSLGLPESCDLPAPGQSVECVVPTGQSKAIKFDGKDTEKPTGEIRLKIEKANETSYPLGYKFTLLSSSDVQLSSSDTVKANTNTVFKIKKESNSLSLERAWKISDLLGKVGLSGCTDENNQCSIKTPDGSLKIKRNGKTLTTNSISTGGGKIKMKKDQANYSQGFKFTIEDNDITISGGTAPNNKLEELETYEIVEEENNFYLSRKTNKEESIKSSLSIPEECFRNQNTSCTLTSEQLQKINFNGKDSPSGTATLKISRENNNTSEFPLGYKFTFQSTQDITIKTNTNIVKANTPYDFKIKRESGKPISLEKAWTAATLGAKVGLQNCSENNGCTIQSNWSNINVKHGEDKSDTNLSKNGSSGSGTEGKIKVAKDQEGYNQGFKFTISDASIGLTGGTKNEDDEKIKSLDEYETYEIKKEGSNWYLVRKDKAEVFIKKQLNIGEFCSEFPTEVSRLKTCNDIKDVNKLKNINFYNKESFANSWPTSVSGVQIEINKEASFPGGFKFTFNGCKKEGSNPCCLPGSDNALNDTNGGFVYQIKKSAGSENICLEPKPKSGGSSSGGQCTK